MRDVIKQPFWVWFLADGSEIRHFRDGLPNLVEYILDGDPGSFSPSIRPTLSVDGVAFDFAFRRKFTRVAETDQRFEYSSDMVHWTSVPLDQSGMCGVILGGVDGNGMQEVRVTVPRGANESLFGRLSVVPR